MRRRLGSANSSNQNLNYYKFGLGLGVASNALDKKGAVDGKGETGKKGETAEAAAGGADQYVLYLSSADH